MIVTIRFINPARGVDLWCGEFESESFARALCKRLNRNIVPWASPRAQFVVRLQRGCF